MARKGAQQTKKERALLVELETVWQQVAAIFGAHSCPGTTECCRFAVTGREPYVTSIELCAIARAVAARGGPLKDKRRAAPLASRVTRVQERTCALLDQQARCVIYPSRPLGCRTYYCDRVDRDRVVRQREISALVRQVQEIAARHRPGGDQGRPLSRALRDVDLR
jgi:hypothetical protein